MHPLALTTYPRRVAVTRSRSSRRRVRRAAIAVVVGLLGAGAGQAYADPPQHTFHQHLPGSHANVHHGADWASVQPPAVLHRHDALGRIHATTTADHTVPGNRPAGNGSFDAWPAVVIAVVAALGGAVALTRRNRLPSTT
jgi:hypothetical protein